MFNLKTGENRGTSITIRTMKQFNKKEYNRMCAEFLGWEYINKDFHETAYTNYGWWIKDTYHNDVDSRNTNWKGFNTNLKFDSDWNWIMEILIEITKKGWNWELIDFNGTVSEEKCFKCSIFNLNLSERLNKFTCESSNNKKAAVQTIWNFLNWYNKNQINNETKSNT